MTGTNSTGAEGTGHPLPRVGLVYEQFKGWVPQRPSESSDAIEVMWNPARVQHSDDAVRAEDARIHIEKTLRGPGYIAFQGMDLDNHAQPEDDSMHDSPRD